MKWLSRYLRWCDRRKNPLPYRRINQDQYRLMEHNQRHRWNRRLGG